MHSWYGLLVAHVRRHTLAVPDFGQYVIARSIDPLLSDAQQALLRRGGIIIANELTTKTDFLTLTFGLTDGWWLYDDPQWRMPGGICCACHIQHTRSTGDDDIPQAEECCHLLNNR